MGIEAKINYQLNKYPFVKKNYKENVSKNYVHTFSKN